MNKREFQRRSRHYAQQEWDAIKDELLSEIRESYIQTRVYMRELEAKLRLYGNEQAS